MAWLRCIYRPVVLVGALTSWVAADAAPPVQQPMGAPVAGLTPGQLDRFEKGRVSFNKVFLAFEGLGPGFNKDSCGGCHNAPVGGSGSIAVTRFGTTDKGEFNPLAELGGSLLQKESISAECTEFVPPEATITTQRITTSALGLGLVEAIPDAAIVAHATNPPRGPAPVGGDPFLNPEHITGRVHWVTSLEDPNAPARPGRMGWKGQLASVLSFSGDATLNEMGITNALVPDENPPNGNYEKLAMCDTVADPEDHPDAEGFTFIERVTDFQRFLAAPPQTPKSGMAGEAIFIAIGCAQCHVATAYTTSNDPNLETALRNKTIKPYSDYLLHSLGTAGDGIVQGDAKGDEFRTPPLWGLRIRDPMIHDGSVLDPTFAEKVNSAILKHAAPASEANISVAAYQALINPDKAKLFAFLDSLGRREFDANGDNLVDAVDVVDLADCYGGGPYTPDDACAVHDVDQDGDVDDDDVAAFLAVYSGWSGDCNKDGIIDVKQILAGTLVDADVDGYPDSCCPGDLNNDGVVNQSDLGILLAAYGKAAAGDLDGDFDTDQSDLGILLGLYQTSCR
jgi:CxxC motif-containing protein (DUF1111 family)